MLLSGEPGIGKSRLTAALMERLATEPHTRLRYFCSPQHTDSALYPIISQMERAAGFTHDDTAQAKLDKLDAVLAQTSTSIRTRPCLPKCCRCRTMDVIPRSNWLRSSGDRRHWKRLPHKWKRCRSSNPVLMIFEECIGRTQRASKRLVGRWNA